MNIFKNIVSTSLICGILVTGCGADAAKHHAETPEEAIHTALTALRELDMQTFNACTNNRKSEKRRMFSDLLENEREAYLPLAQIIVEHLSWEINEIQENGDTATANITIRNKDFSNALGNYVADIIRYVEEQHQTGADISVLIGNIAKESRNNPELLIPYLETCDQECTVDLIINLTRVDETWQIQLDDTLCDSLVGHAGIDDFSKDIEPILQSAEEFLHNNLKRWGVEVEKNTHPWVEQLKGTVNDLLH